MKFEGLNLCLGTGALVAALVCAPLADADVIVTDPGSRTLRNNGTSNYKGSSGYVFTVNTAANISVTHLGIFDAPGNEADGSTGAIGDGLERSAEVAIYKVHTNGVDSNTGRTIFVNDGEITRATVATGTGGTLLNSYRYVSLDTPVTLLTGGMYQIIMGVHSGGNGFLNYAGGTAVPTINADFTIDSTAVHNTGGNYDDARFSAGGGGDGRTGSPYSGPNFQYVPEPASLALLALGGVMIAGRHRR